MICSFVLHAPRQTGKTSALLALRDLLNGGAHGANPIYAEVVPRHLNYAVQETLPQQMAWYVGADGGLDVEGLIAAFQEFFRDHSEHWVQRFEQYHEAGPQLLLQAHLQRIVNGGGRLEREYALGRGRTDLLIVWPQGERERRFVVECKVLRKGLERTIAEGMEQTRGYMDRCGAEAGHLIVFDRAGPNLGGKDLPPRAGGSWRAGHGLGDVAPSSGGAPGCVDFPCAAASCRSDSGV